MKYTKNQILSAKKFHLHCDGEDIDYCCVIKGGGVVITWGQQYLNYTVEEVMEHCERHGWVLYIDDRLSIYKANLLKE